MLQYHFNWKTISVAAGMTCWNFYFQVFERAIGKEEVVEFLMRLLQHLSGPLLIIWDQLPAHRSRFVAEFVRCLEGEIEMGVATLGRRSSGRDEGAAGLLRCGRTSNDQSPRSGRWLGVGRWPRPCPQSSAFPNAPSDL